MEIGIACVSRRIEKREAWTSCGSAGVRDKVKKVNLLKMSQKVREYGMQQHLAKRMRMKETRTRTRMRIP